MRIAIIQFQVLTVNVTMLAVKRAAGTCRIFME